MEQQSSPERDTKLWAIAQKRASFKRELVTYFAVNAFLWLVWFLTNGKNGYSGGIPWPVWPTAGWGIAMVIQYFEAFKYSKEDTAEKEYEKLKRKQQ